VRRWRSRCRLDAAIPGFIVSDSYQSTAAGEFCSVELVKTSTHGTRKAEERTTHAQKRRHALTMSDGGGQSEIRRRMRQDALSSSTLAELGQGRLPPAASLLRRPTSSARARRAPRPSSEGPARGGGARRGSLQGRSETTSSVGARRRPHAAHDSRPVEAGSSRWNWCAEMRLGFFSPMPPSKSGIADYSAALLEPLARLHQVEVSIGSPPRSILGIRPPALPARQQPYHEFVYRMALRHPGVVVMHDPTCII